MFFEKRFFSFHVAHEDEDSLVECEGEGEGGMLLLLLWGEIEGEAHELLVVSQGFGGPA